MLDVCLLGTGGMMPLPYRALTSMMIRYNGSSILGDCGEGTQVAVKQQGWSFKPIDVILFTHFHADHISGLPGLLLTIGNAERKDPVLMVGPKRLERVVNSLRVIAPELPFEIQFKELTEEEIAKKEKQEKWMMNATDIATVAFIIHFSCFSCIRFTYLYSTISSNGFLGLLSGASSAKPTATIPVNWLSVPIKSISSL